MSDAMMGVYAKACALYLYTTLVSCFGHKVNRSECNHEGKGCIAPPEPKLPDELVRSMKEKGVFLDLK